MAEAFPISGNIDPKTFPFLLADLHRQGATGSLKVEGPSYPKALYFRGGRDALRIVERSQGPARRHPHRERQDHAEQLDEVNTKVGPGNPLAKVLAESGFVNQRELSRGGPGQGRAHPLRRHLLLRGQLRVRGRGAAQGRRRPEALHREARPGRRVAPHRSQLRPAPPRQPGRRPEPRPRHGRAHGRAAAGGRRTSPSASTESARSRRRLASPGSTSSRPRRWPARYCSSGSWRSPRPRPGARAPRRWTSAQTARMALDDAAVGPRPPSPPPHPRSPPSSSRRWRPSSRHRHHHARHPGSALRRGGDARPWVSACRRPRRSTRTTSPGAGPSMQASASRRRWPLSPSLPDRPLPCRRETSPWRRGSLRIPHRRRPPMIDPRSLPNRRRACRRPSPSRRSPPARPDAPGAAEQGRPGGPRRVAEPVGGHPDGVDADPTSARGKVGAAVQAGGGPGRQPPATDVPPPSRSCPSRRRALLLLAAGAGAWFYFGRTPKAPSKPAARIAPAPPPASPSSSRHPGAERRLPDAAPAAATAPVSPSTTLAAAPPSLAAAATHHGPGATAPSRRALPSLADARRLLAAPQLRRSGAGIRGQPALLARRPGSASSSSWRAPKRR